MHASVKWWLQRVWRRVRTEPIKVQCSHSSTLSSNDWLVHSIIAPVTRLGGQRRAVWAVDLNGLIQILTAPSDAGDILAVVTDHIPLCLFSCYYAIHNGTLLLIQVCVVRRLYEFRRLICLWLDQVGVGHAGRITWRISRQALWLTCRVASLARFGTRISAYERRETVVTALHKRVLGRCTCTVALTNNWRAEPHLHLANVWTWWRSARDIFWHWPSTDCNDCRNYLQNGGGVHFRMLLTFFRSESQELPHPSSWELISVVQMPMSGQLPFVAH